ncbi:MAG: hypothetical protein AAF234_15605 [Pseudomonadota bacterium]
MNRLDPRLETKTQSRVLDQAHLSAWSADGFEMARRLARAPLSVTGGIASTRLTLGLALQDPTEAQIFIPLHVHGDTALLALNERALDSLASLLERNTAPGAGRTLSLDAVEALLAGLLAPLALDGIGRASLAADAEAAWTRPTIAALQFEACDIPVLGTDAALAKVYDQVAAKMDRLVAAPLSYLKSTHQARAAVEVETLVGMAALNAEERAKLEPSGAVLLDAHWPSGRTSVGRRFVASEDGWRVDDCLANRYLMVRSGTLVRGLDDPALHAPVPSTGLLELVEGREIIATGHLASLSEGDDLQPIFVLDQTG